MKPYKRKNLSDEKITCEPVVQSMRLRMRMPAPVRKTSSIAKVYRTIPTHGGVDSPVQDGARRVSVSLMSNHLDVTNKLPVSL